MTPRVLKDPDLRSARDGFKLQSFYSKTSDERKNVWFRALDLAWAKQRLLLNEDPPPEVLVESLITALEIDESFAAWMEKRTDLEWRTKNENWKVVERALACVIVQDYLSACEDGRWSR
ncbi:MAG: hypothetical protein ACLQBY_02610 [Solirubrobacteraceae bacterium]